MIIAKTTLLLFVCADALTRINGFTTSCWNHGSIGLNQVNGGIDRVSLQMSFPQERNRKRDRIMRCLRNTGVTAVNNLSFSRPSSMALRATSNNNNEKDENEESMLEKWKSKMPKQIIEFWTAMMAKLTEILPGLKIGVASFITGAVIGIGAILVPVYNSVDTMTEPVTLFETILTDLDRGYVDSVDTTKLFETGVSAMLRSLDPYTEFEGKQEAIDMNESVSGKYGGIGLVITGAVAKDDLPEDSGSKLLPKDAVDDSKRLNGDDDLLTPVTINAVSGEDFGIDGEDDEDTLKERMERKKALQKARDNGIRVVSAFEGYAFDYGMRAGDKLVAIDGNPITPSMTVEDVRNQLRGEPGTEVSITFERIGLDGQQTVQIPRTIVRIRDVKLATLIGKPENGVGYIQLSGFAANAGLEVRSAILALQQATEEASGGERSLQSLVLDLRGNPGGLLTSAVDVASCFVPKGSDIVSARGRGFPAVLYRSRVDPVLDSNTKLAVLVNGQTASAAEIVSGAIQDLDVGVIVGSDRTFGKGLVQNVEELPFDTALKFTVAKYYTPSGRCIQSTNYKEGGGLDVSKSGYTAQKVADKDKTTFYTKNGREVKDGGGVEADFKVSAPKASALEVSLLRSGVFGDFAAEWSKKHELTNNFNVDDDTYKEFQQFVMKKQNDGDIKLEQFYSGAIDELRKILNKSGYKGSASELDRLRADIIREMERDFDKYRTDIKEDIGQNILARYLPESMLIERGMKTDKQVNAAVKLLEDKATFNKLLARIDNTNEIEYASSGNSLNTASIDGSSDSSIRVKLEW